MCSRENLGMIRQGEYCCGRSRVLIHCLKKSTVLTIVKTTANMNVCDGNRGTSCDDQCVTSRFQTHHADYCHAVCLYSVSVYLSICLSVCLWFCAYYSSQTKPMLYESLYVIVGNSLCQFFFCTAQVPCSPHWTCFVFTDIYIYSHTSIFLSVTEFAQLNIVIATSTLTRNSCRLQCRPCIVSSVDTWKSIAPEPDNAYTMWKPALQTVIN